MTTARNEENMWNPQTTDFSTWVRNEFAHLAEKQAKRREKSKVYVYVDIHESSNNMPGERLFSWRGEVECDG